jgi:hypothetical protein
MWYRGKQVTGEPALARLPAPGGSDFNPLLSVPPIIASSGTLQILKGHGLDLRWFRFEVESGLGEEPVDESRPVLDALERFMSSRIVRETAVADPVLTQPDRQEPLRAIQFSCPGRPGAPTWQIKRRATSSPRRRSQMKPDLTWATLTSTATAIPMPASTAIGGGAKRPDDRHGRALVDLVAGARGPSWVAGRSARRSLSSPQVRAVRARPVRSSNSPAVSLPAWKCSPRSDTTASRSESEAFI